MLKDYVQTDLSAEEIGDLLTMTGFELEEITEAHGESVLDVNIMANRGDGASVLGMARELVAKTERATPTELFHRAAGRFEVVEGGECPATIRIETPNCTRYACRIFPEVENGPSPEWLKIRLEQCGQRSISLLVDLTNYVMLEVGQPLHAFDMEKLGDTIVIRQARNGEKLTTLDGAEHELTDECMMICDASRPVAAAGVMGGEDTEVGPDTQTCLLESAHFSPQTVRRTKNILGIKTEASYRFERWVDPDGVVGALNRFAELYQQITGKGSLPGVADSYPGRSTGAALSVRPQRARKLLGMEVSDEDCLQSLSRLGYEPVVVEDSIRCRVPSWRADVSREEDLVEEIGRVYGYEKIPELPPHGYAAAGGAHGIELFGDEARGALLRCGLDQVMTHTLRGEGPLDRAVEKVRVRTPHSPEVAWLRSSMLPGLADCALRNGGRGLQLFEIGRVFENGKETTQLGAMMIGALDEPTWGGLKPAMADFFTLKGVIESLCHSLHVPFEIGSSHDDRFHPTRQASLGEAGVFGQLHPDIQEALGFPEPVLAAEIDLDVLMPLAGVEQRLKPISRNPAIRRDVAVVTAKTVAYAELDGAIRNAGGDVLEKHWLFDVYEGKGVPDGHHSLAIALQFRKLDGTFTDEEANQVRDRIVAALASAGATLR
jgi:phenylalanyl-tRNA synthetase beta chain